MVQNLFMEVKADIKHLKTRLCVRSDGVRGGGGGSEGGSRRCMFTRL